MRTRQALTASLLAAAGLACAVPAQAQVYIGASLGQSRYDDSVAERLISSGTVDGSGTGLKVYAGYEFNQHFAAEAAYVNLGKAKYSGDFFGSPVTDGQVKASGLNLAAVGTLPLNPKFSLFGKLGVFVWEAKASDVTGGTAFSEKADGSDVSFGVGLSYALSRSLSLRAEWERFKAADADTDLLSIGLAYRF